MTLDYVLASLAAFNPLLHRGGALPRRVTPAGCAGGRARAEWASC